MLKLGLDVGIHVELFGGGLFRDLGDIASSERSTRFAEDNGSCDVMNVAVVLMLMPALMLTVVLRKAAYD